MVENWGASDPQQTARFCSGILDAPGKSKLTNAQKKARDRL
jgi:hypothetical protein